MKRNHYILAGILCTAFPLLAQAQTQPADSTLNRTVVVEQEYNPDIPDASKVNILPPVEEPTVSRKEVKYDATMNPSTALQSEPIGAYTAPEEPQRYTPGYVRAGYGSRGNLDLLANYLFRLSAQDKLDLNFRMEGMNGKTDDLIRGGSWSSFYYRTRGQALYQHTFHTLDLNIGGSFGQSNFNLTPQSLIPKQKLSSGHAHIGVLSTDKEAPLHYKAETHILFYNRQQDVNSTGNKETLIRTKADVRGELQEDQFIGIAVEMNNLFYSYEQTDIEADNYTTVDLNPYFLWNTDSWDLRLGAHADFSLGTGTTFRASPDIEAGYTFSDTYRVYASATGGRRLNDFRTLEENSPYGIIRQGKPEDTYELIHATLGLKGSPFPGTWFHLFGGYRNIKKELYHSSALFSTGNEGVEAILYQTANSDNLHGGAELGYAYKDLLSLAFTATGYHWNSKEDFALLLKPVFAGKVEAGFRPVHPLWITAGYEYIQHEKISSYGGENGSLPAIHDLRLSATYNFYKGVSIYAHVNNLLNKKNQYYINYPVQGFNFLGGLSFRF
ncbi:MAG: TonB-dependent receptor [Bacteroides sp.]|nr:TonB-dependent receptor [Bacteroides sp.]